MKITEIDEALNELELFKKTLNKLLGSSKGYSKLDEILKDSKSIFDTSKFKIGDTIVLNQTPEISTEVRYGWTAFKHFIVKGALGQIYDVEFSNGNFQYWISFENDSYIHPINHQVIKSDKPHYFVFGDEFLEKYEEAEVKQILTFDS